MSKVVVLGAGPMGLAAGYEAVKRGHDVDIVEAGDKVGGMAAHFDFGGLSIERYYHFICKTDTPTFELMDELGIGDKMRWVRTTMGYYIDGKIESWGNPWALLKFPHLNMIEKFRTGLQMFLTTRTKSFDHIEHLTAREWIERGSGQSVYNKLWRPLNELKFYELADDISASWMATRVKRIGNSRKNLFEEQLGYIEGGSETLMEALADSIREAGGRIHLSTPAQEAVIDGSTIKSVRTSREELLADSVISTVPTPLIERLVPSLNSDLKRQYAGIRNIGVVCLIFKLNKSVSPHFWLNIADSDFGIPGIVEFSHLRPMSDGSHIVYVPYYMPPTQEKWSWTDEKFIDEAFGFLTRINPQITREDLLDVKAGRLQHAQPVCEPQFLDRLPPIQTEVQGLQIADTCFYYPEDRGIAESIRLGRRMAARV